MERYRPQGTVRGESCFVSFVLLYYQYRFHEFFVVFLFLFSFHQDEAGAVCNGLERENGGLMFVVVTLWETGGFQKA